MIDLSWNMFESDPISGAQIGLGQMKLYNGNMARKEQ